MLANLPAQFTACIDGTALSCGRLFTASNEPHRLRGPDHVELAMSGTRRITPFPMMDTEEEFRKKCETAASSVPFPPLLQKTCS